MYHSQTNSSEKDVHCSIVQQQAQVEMNEAMFMELYNGIRLKLYYWAKNKLGSKEEAEDVLMDVFMELWSRKSTPPKNIEAFIYACVRNAIIDRARRLNRWRISPIPIEDMVEENNHEGSMLTKKICLMYNSINHLPVYLRTIMFLFYIERKTVQEIADALKTNAKSIYSAKHRAIQILRLKLHEYRFE